MVEPVVFVHGGAWNVPELWTARTIEGVKFAASTGMRILNRGGSALDAVEGAVMTLEDNKYFNAGRGSSLNLAGEVQMEASIQQGSDLKAGCVTFINNIQHPISLARKVMQETPHVFLGGEGARLFALRRGVETLQPSHFVTDLAMEELDRFLKMKEMMYKDTVGAVVVDRNGHVAAGTSTGGTVGKYVGRIGDVPQIGCGLYADDYFGAVSATGHGESISKFCLSHTIIKYMEVGVPVQEAVTKAVEGMSARVNNTGGAIAVDVKGDVGFHFTTNRMSWCYVKGGVIHYGIDKEQHEQEALA